jgi:NAD(P)-dependent dehydrogenase (short-subunit alcohol dehydrogenase family)
MNKLEGKVAVITGASSGIGLATAQLFVSEGAHVYITGRRQSELDAAVQQIGKNVTSVQSDVSNFTDLAHLYATVKQHHEHIDILFANAGVGESAALGEISEAHFDKLFSINVKGLLFTVQKALPLILDGSTIILTAATSSTKGTAGSTVYSATKAAVRSFARTWALELKDRKVRVNAVSPSPTDTPFWEKQGLTQEQLERFKARLVSTIPLGRLCNPSDVAKAVLFLASDDSSFITGIELAVDGGRAQI